MARFCLETGYTPTEFWELEFSEYSAMVEELNRRK
tara:strand:+ start:2294 stop:2398 length:105 start_codon:yes stop_codon:yes gene_type:complete